MAPPAQGVRRSQSGTAAVQHFQMPVASQDDLPHNLHPVGGSCGDYTVGAVIFGASGIKAELLIGTRCIDGRSLQHLQPHHQTCTGAAGHALRDWQLHNPRWCAWSTLPRLRRGITSCISCVWQLAQRSCRSCSDTLSASRDGGLWQCASAIQSFGTQKPPH
jgi:hypothetical protein